MANWQEVLHAVSLLLAEKVHGTLTVLPNLPDGMAATRYLLAERLAIRKRLLASDPLLWPELLLEKLAEAPVANPRCTVWR
ncbi:hypothetical protein [Olsenella porci]|uniref:hypothetical protein n=1 Tax=Olsenella porci TaxID=2652279 RepID=UPI001E2EC3C9|nr:hypothetical protein [Olsenella porci]